MPLPTPLRVLFLCSEADPLVKVGGLGDVGGSLPPALRALKTYLSLTGDEMPVDIDIRVVIPFHGAINRELFKPQRVAFFNVQHKSGMIPAEAYQVEINQVTFYLISGGPIGSQVPIYTNNLGADANKYIFFSLAALELAREIGFQPHIVHANDWHTSAAIYWLKLYRDRDDFFRKASTLLSIHNLPFMGFEGSLPMDGFYLPPAPAGIFPDWARHLPLPLGLYSADHINAVSPTYGKEILTPEFGAGLESFLRTRSASISGIINGIDPDRWDPATDANIHFPFSADRLQERQANKAALLKEVGFPELDETNQDRTLLFAMVSRMDYQKGVDLAVEALEQLGRTDDRQWRALILGTGLLQLEESISRLQALFPDKVRAVVKFDAPLSHRIYAGADTLLMPSRYEPCGLAQMIAMRYGCIPLARATGGLADTIMDAGESNAGTGFLFHETSPKALLDTLLRALDLFQDPEAWQALQKRGMPQDFSWQRSAIKYLQLYEKLVTTRFGTQSI
jgi:starch synthase